MNNGIKVLGTSTFAMDGKEYDIPNRDIEMETIFQPEEQNYHRIFIPHANEPLCAQKALEPFLLQLSWKHDKITETLKANAEYLGKLQRDLQAPEAAKLIADDVKDYMDFVAKARQSATDQQAFASEVRQRAALLPESANDHEATLRAMTQQTMRQELASRYGAKRLGSHDAERTINSLSRIGKMGDVDQELNLMAAVRGTTLFEASTGTVGMAEARFVETCRPWVAGMEEIAKAVVKATANRMSFEALPALKKALPFGLTPESILEIVEGKPKRENLTEKMAKAA